MILRATVLLVAVVFAAAQKDPHWLDGRNTIVHLFEWKFSDIAAECERFLAPYGYAGVQTSPVNEYMCMPYYNHPWWERYQPISHIIYSRSGDEEAFADMVRRCNDVGVRIYVDVVFNHMSGNVPEPVGCAGSVADPPNLIYPDYGPDDFHHPACGIDNYNDKYQVRNCELSGLHDLDQSVGNVRETIKAFLDKLVDHGVAGFRVDAAKHMWPEDLEFIYESVKDLNTDHGFEAGSRPFYYQEVIDKSLNEGVHNYEYTGFGVVTEFRYGMELSNCFRGNNMLKWLVNWGPAWSLLPTGDALAFIDNHDTQRGSDTLTYKDTKIYKSAIAFMLAWPYGITRIMSSYYFTDNDAGPPADEDYNILDVTINSDITCGNGWVCEHRWRQMFNMVAFKNTVAGTTVNDWWDNGNNQIAFCRGGSGFAAFNNQLDTDLKQTLQTCLPAGTYCDLISGSKSNNSCSGKTVEVGSDGKAYIEILAPEKDGALAITIDTKL